MKPAWTGGGRTGPVREYVDLKVFACEGLVVIIDERPGAKCGEYTVVTPTELEQRLHALNQTYRGKTRADLLTWQRQEYDRQKVGSQNCVECIKEARAMGDPSDPRVQIFWEKHRRSSTIRVSFSPGSDPAGYPTLPEIPRGNFTGKTADTGVAPTATELHKLPKPKRSGLILLDM